MRNDPRLPDETLLLPAFSLFSLRQLLPLPFDFPNVLLPSPFHDVVLFFDGGHCAADTPRWGVGPRGVGRGRRLVSPPELTVWLFPPELLRSEPGGMACLRPLARDFHGTTFCAGFVLDTLSFYLPARAVNFEEYVPPL